MRRFTDDLRVALRGFRRTPGFVVTAIAILAIGIGMATAVFTVYHAVLLRRLPVRDQDRLVVLWGTAGGTLGRFSLPYPSYAEFRDRSRAFSSVAAVSYSVSDSVPMRVGTTTVEVHGEYVSGNFFRTLGAQAYVGRLIDSSDDVPGAARTLVLSYAGWQRIFLGDPAVVGRSFTFLGDSVPARVVGIAAPGLELPRGNDMWGPVLAFAPQALSDSAYVGVDVLGRLAPGATLAQARSEFLSAVRTARLNASPDFMRSLGATVETLPDFVRGDVRPALVALAIAVALLLLIACANVGNLLLVRAGVRAHDMAIRRALGAGLADVLRQLAAECLVIGVLGWAAGVLLSVWLLRVLLALAPPELPRLAAIRLGPAPLLIAVAVTVTSTLIFGLTPALWAERQDIAAPLRSAARGGSRGRPAQLARRILVGWQVALATMVLAAAGLVARSLERLERLDPGYRATGLAVAPLLIQHPTGTEVEQRRALLDHIIERVDGLPGVVTATVAWRGPFSAYGLVGAFVPEGHDEGDPIGRSYVDVEICGPDYFRTFGIPILQGRAFTPADREGAPLVVILSASAARKYWPNQDPIGKRLRYPGALNAGQQHGAWRTVVGIVPDTHFRSYRAVEPTLYHPYGDFWAAPTVLVLRTSGPPDALSSSVRHAVAEAAPDVDVIGYQSVDDLEVSALAQPRLNAALLSAFGIAALVLAAIGLYAVTATAVRQQTREIGVRIALGATAGEVRQLVLGEALVVVGIGAAVGVGGAIAASRFVRSVLFEVSPTDPATLATACAVLMGAGAVAAYVPARRATRIDPVQALREE